MEEIIDNRGSRTLLCALRESIATTSAKIQDANKDYVSKTSDRDELSAADAWLVEAEEKTDLAYSYIQAYLNERRDDTPSSVAHSRADSQISASTTVSQRKLKEAKLEVEQADRRVETIKRRTEEKIRTATERARREAEEETLAAIEEAERHDAVSSRERGG